MLRGALANVTGGDGGPHGCLRVTASVACGEGAESIRCEIMERTKAGKDSLVARFERAKAEGDLPPHVDPEGLTRVLIAYLQGISVQANMGEPREELEKLVDTALDDLAERLNFIAPSKFFIGRYRNLLDVAYLTLY